MFEVFTLTKTNFRLKSKLMLLALIVSVIGCESDNPAELEVVNVGLANIKSDAYLIRTDTEIGPVYLRASPGHGPQLVGGEFLESVPIENASIVWEFSAEETLTMRSQSILISDLNLVVRADSDLMQIAMVGDNAVNTQFADWRFVPLDNGRC